MAGAAKSSAISFFSPTIASAFPAKYRKNVFGSTDPKQIHYIIEVSSGFLEIREEGKSVKLACIFGQRSSDVACEMYQNTKYVAKENRTISDQKFFRSSTYSQAGVRFRVSCHSFPAVIMERHLAFVFFFKRKESQ